jgi:peptidyl-dipeptidase Dcp
MSQRCLVVAFLVLPACMNTEPAPAASSSAATPPAAPAAAASNPLLAKWSGPYGGVPPLAAVKVEHFVPALEDAMKENLAEIDAIASNRSRRTSRTRSPRSRTPGGSSTACRPSTRFSSRR